MSTRSLWRAATIGLLGLAVAVTAAIVSGVGPASGSTDVRLAGKPTDVRVADNPTKGRPDDLTGRPVRYPRISNLLLGQPDAAVDVFLDKTQYPNDAVLYVKEFIKAWQFGNTARISSPAVVNKVPSTPPTSVTYLPLDCCGGGLAQVKVKIGNATARFDAGTMKLGGPHAILDYAVEFGFTS